MHTDLRLKFPDVAQAGPICKNQHILQTFPKYLGAVVEGSILPGHTTLFHNNLRFSGAMMSEHRTAVVFNVYFQRCMSQYTGICCDLITDLGC